MNKNSFSHLRKEENFPPQIDIAFESSYKQCKAEEG